MIITLRIVLAALALLICTGLAQAGRVALVIGNSDYAAAGQLANPKNDATDIAAKLRSLGFTVVDGYDLSKRQMEQKIGAFADALEEADTGLFYYAGHGISVDGRNYILPVDARLDIPAKLRLEAVQVDDVLELMTQQVPTAIVFLDACRNNPFARSLGRKSKTRGVQVAEGLAQIDSMRGSFIAFSTAPGSVAMDGSGRNSPFAAALLRYIGEPDQSINDLMIAVRRDVLKETRDFQNPMSWDSLTNRFSFVSELEGEPSVAAQPAAPAVAPEPSIAAVEPELTTSQGDLGASVERFLTEAYLAPTPETIEQDVDRMFLDQVISYGQVYTKARLTRVKKNWFRKYKSWKIDLVRGSLTLDQADGGRVIATFFVNYVYERRAGKPLTGRSGVRLELVPHAEYAWRVASEQAFP